MWSRACSSSLFVPSTATGGFSAIRAAVSSAALTTSPRPPSTTRETRPTARASVAEKLRAVRASSDASDWLPVIFGRRASVPISAASPTSTSCEEAER